MFEKSSSISKFAAGSGIDTIESRVQHLEAMINAVNSQKKSSPSKQADLHGSVSFKSYLGNTAPPPKIQPLTSSMKERFDSVQPLVEKYSAEYVVDPALVNAVIRQESGFNPNAVSNAGAQGLMQLMPSTARDLGVKNPFDPEQNLEGGIRHLSALLQKYQGNITLALAAYNAGGGAVSQYNGIPPYQETRNYVRRVLTAYLSEKSNN